MIAKEELFLYEYLKLCNQYFESRDKNLLNQISEMYRRDLTTQNFIFNALPRATRCYSGRISYESAEDISKLEEGETFTFSKLITSPVRVWCKDKKKLHKFVENKLFSRPGKGIIVTALIPNKHILFDYDAYNTIVSQNQLQEAFTGTLKEYCREFKPLKVEETVKEVLVESTFNKAEVMEVISPLDDIDQQKLVAEIKKSLGC